MVAGATGRDDGPVTVESPTLTRPSAGRIVAGVAAGVAHRLGVDPILVRIGFVALVLTSGPIGFVLYAAGWFLMPLATSDRRRSRPEGSPVAGRRSSPPTVVLVILGIVAILAIDRLPLNLGGLPVLLIVAGSLLFWWSTRDPRRSVDPVARRRGSPGRERAAMSSTRLDHTTVGEPSFGDPTFGGDTALDDDDPWGPEPFGRSTWGDRWVDDPWADHDRDDRTWAGADRDAVVWDDDDLDDPGRDAERRSHVCFSGPPWALRGHRHGPCASHHHDRRPRGGRWARAEGPVVVDAPPRVRLTLLTLGALVVGGGVLAGLAAQGVAVDPRLAAIGGLAVIGFALMLGSWLGRPSGLMPIGLLVVVGLTLTSVVDLPIGAGIGEREYRPTTVAALADRYELLIGELTVDLSELDPAELARAGDEHHVRVAATMAEVVVIVPRGVDVDIRARGWLGDISIPGAHDEGGGLELRQRIESESDTTLVLDARVGLGELTVRQAPLTADPPTPTAASTTAPSPAPSTTVLR